VVRVLGYRLGGPGSIPGTTRFSEKKKKKRKTSSGSGTGSTQPREYNWGATWYKSSGSCLENREYGRRDPSRWPRGTLYPQKLATTSPRSGVRSRTQTMEFSLFVWRWPIRSKHVVSLFAIKRGSVKTTEVASRRKNGTKKPELHGV
jgi:hypothetical protein